MTFLESRRSRMATLTLIDGVLIALAWMLAYCARFAFAIPNDPLAGEGYFPQMLAWLPAVLVVQLVLFRVLGVYRGIMRYSGLRDALRIVQAVALTTLFIVIANLILERMPSFLGILPLDEDAEHVLRVPLTIQLLIYPAFAVLLTGGLRFSRRLFTEGRRRYTEDASATLVVGAGNLAETALRDLLRAEESRFRPVCAVATQPGRVGTELQGVPVVGTLEAIPRVLRERGVQTVLIALDEDDPATVREVVRHCQDAKVHFHIIPSLNAIASGRVDVRALREVRVEDLLGREPVDLSLPQERNSVRGEVVLITGAGGSIGSELARQVARAQPARLLLLGRGENSIHEIDQELRRTHPKLPVERLIADIRDLSAMTRIFETYGPTVIFHAAAHKHVPLMEENPAEAIMNNVWGTAVVAGLAKEFGARRFLLISSDKAVRPTSVMGATKRLAEAVIYSLGQDGETVFQAVRFGNVLGSRGSVIPTFQKQIAAGGPVTVTHPEVVRYFMTIPEAVSLVLKASSQPEGNTLFLLDMGQPVRIADLAKNLITLSGLKEGQDIRIEYTGLRPGEKLHEELLTQEEGAHATGVGKVWATAPRWVWPWEDLRSALWELLDVAETGTTEMLLNFLRDLVPDFEPAQATLERSPQPVGATAEGLQRVQRLLAGREAIPARRRESPTPALDATMPEEGPAAWPSSVLEPFSDEPTSEHSSLPPMPPETPPAPDAPETPAQRPSDIVDVSALASEAEPEPAPVAPVDDATRLASGESETPFPVSSHRPAGEQDERQETPAPLSPEPGGMTPPPLDREILSSLSEEESFPAFETREISRLEIQNALAPQPETAQDNPPDGDPIPTELESQSDMSQNATAAPHTFCVFVDAGDSTANPGTGEVGAFLSHLGSVLGPKGKVFVPASAAGQIPADLKGRVEVLPAEKGNTSAAAVNAAIDRCPGDGLLVIAPPAVRFEPAFFKQAAEFLAGSDETPLVYGDHVLVAPNGQEQREELMDHNGCPHERFDFGPVQVFRVSAVRNAGMFREELKTAWLYDMHLQLMQDGQFRRIPDVTYRVNVPAPKGGAGPLNSPGKGPLGGFSYVFYPEDVEKEVTSVWERALKQVGAWLDHPTVEVPQPKQKPEVMASIVIPVLNRERFIGDAIESVVKGTYPDFEIVIVDNGSTDRTREVVQEWANKYKRVRLHKGTGNSIASAINDGIRVARGKYICQLDSDDIYVPTTLEKMIGHLESHPKCGLVVAYYSLMDADMVPIQNVPLVTHHGYTRNQIIRRDGAGAPRFFPKTVLEEMGLYDDEHHGNFGEDYDMVLKVSEKYDVDRVHEVLYYVRRHSDNSDMTRSSGYKYHSKNRARQQALLRRMKLNESLKVQGAAR